MNFKYISILILIMNGYETNNGDDVVKYQRKQEERLTEEDIKRIAKAVYRIIKPELDEIKEGTNEITEELRDEWSGHE